MKKVLIKGFLITALAVVLVFTVSLTNINAQSVYDDYSVVNLDNDTELVYSLEEMLNYAILDEYMAKAEYEAIIETFGEIKPFTNIVFAEQTHIDLLLPLFEIYGIDLPENNSADFVVIPDSITSALATGVEAEEKNILMYETFLDQDNLPEDVREAFEYLMNASMNHLSAFSKNRNSYLGEDVMNQFKKAFKNKYQGSNGNQGNNNGGTQGSNGSCGN